MKNYLEQKFARYARAISDEYERKEMFRLYCAKVAVYAAFILLTVIFFIEILVFTEESSPEVLDAFFAIYGVTMFLVFATGIASLVLSIKFKKAYKHILERAPHEGEMREVTEYRARENATAKGLRKPRRAGAFVIVVGIIAMIALVAIDAIKNPDSDDFGALGIAGIVVGIAFVVAGMMIFIFAGQSANAAGTSQGGTDTAERIIDNAQGKEYKYSVKNDGNLQNLKYLFPNPELRWKAEGLRRKQGKSITVALIISTFAGLLTALLFFSSLIPSVGAPSGYGVPFFVTLVFVAVICTALPYGVKLDKLEKLQKKELYENPEYALNLKIYREYEAHSKVKGKVLPIVYGLSIITGFAIAAASPDTLWSLCCVIPLLAGLYLNALFVAQLRKKAIPVEREIDEKEAAEARASEPNDYSVSVESPSEEYIISDKDNDEDSSSD